VTSNESKTLTYVALPAWEKMDVARLYAGFFVSGGGVGVFSSSSPQPTRLTASRREVAVEARVERRKGLIGDALQ
jgi:hypothetical protein